MKKPRKLGQKSLAKNEPVQHLKTLETAFPKPAMEL